MNERDLAAELQNQKGDESSWEEVTAENAPSPKSTKRRLAAMISVRLSDTELELVQARAKATGQTVSAYLRGLAIGDLRESDGTRVSHWPGVSVSRPSTALTKVEYPTSLDGGRVLGGTQAHAS